MNRRRMLLFLSLLFWAAAIVAGDIVVDKWRAYDFAWRHILAAPLGPSLLISGVTMTGIFDLAIALLLTTWATED